MTPLVLLAHGSDDPRSAATVRALARAVAARAPDREVFDAYLGHTGPSFAQVCATLSTRILTVVPLLLTTGYHGQVDVPVTVANADAEGLRIHLSGPLCAQNPLEVVAALCRRAGEMGVGFDGLVMVSAGSRSEVARREVAGVAKALGDAMGVRCAAAYVAGAGPDVGAAAGMLRERGVRRVGLASYFLAPGVLHDRALAAGARAGVVGAAKVLGDAPEMARLVLARAESAIEQSAIEPGRAA